MTYVISDIHGNFDKFKEMLELIRFGERDVMYVLGDIVDVGDEPMELLCDLSMRYNIVPIVGEHDLRALKLLTEFNKILTEGGAPDAEIMGELTAWIRDGGAKTLQGFKELDEDMREGIIEYLEEDPSNEENVTRIKNYLAVNGAKA